MTPDQAALFDAPAAHGAPSEELERFASISPCGRFRYALMRAWVPKPTRFVMFVGLNPSTADGMVEDPTLRRCIRFARDWGYDGLWLANLYAYRTPYPQALRRLQGDAVGPETDRWIRAMRAASAAVVVCWGCDRAAADRAPAVLDLLGDVQALGVTKDGHPRHPLYLRADARPTPYETTEAARASAPVTRKDVAR